MSDKWTIGRLDIFDDIGGSSDAASFYPLPGEFDTREEAEKAAKEHFQKAKARLTASSWLTDPLVVVSPSGEQYPAPL